ncbi:glycosyltransferase family 4 protein, partial [Petrachloros mirabilis]
SFDEYHTYYDPGFLRTLEHDEIIRAHFRFEKLKVMKLPDLRRNRGLDYPFLHFEMLQPTAEVIFRNLFSRRNIPVTRRVYAVATNDHLQEFLDLCLLADGRPYDSIVVPSHPTREALLAYFADVSSVTGGRVHHRGRVDVIPHGINFEQFPPRDKLRSREKLGIPCDPTVLLSLARISSATKMNYDRLLEFFFRLTTRSGADLLLVIAGNGSSNESQELLRAASEFKIADKIRLITNFGDEIKADIFSCADVFVSLSDNLQESFGIALIEAMAMGLPVICTDWNGHKDIVDDGVTGYRIPTVWKVTECPEDILVNLMSPYSHCVVHRVSRDIHVDMDALVARALQLIRHEDLRRQMGQNGREKAQRTYSVKTEVLRFEALWQELAEMAQKDNKEYRDLAQILNYDYPRHFCSYPTHLENGTSGAIPNGMGTQDARARQGATT